MKTAKNSDTIRDIHKAEDTWTLENALHVLKNPTVDSKIWAEAVEWLLLYGPPNIKNILLSASGNATSNCFPEMKSTKSSLDGEPCFTITDIAKALEIDEEEARNIILKKEKAHGVSFTLGKDETLKKH